MAIVNKNFRVKNGLIVDGSVATVNGYNVLTEASTAFIISTVGGSADTANTPNTVVKRDGSGNFAAGTITASIVGNLTGDVTGTVSSLSNHDTGDLAEGSNLYFTNARALSATAAAYDAAGAASSAQANAATDATAKVAAEVTARNSAIASAIATEVSDRNTAIATAKTAAEATAATDATTKANAAQSAAISAAAADATSKANAAQSAAEATASADATSKANAAQSAAEATASADATSKANAAQSAAIAAAATAAGTALSTAISTEVSNRNTAISNAVDSLVDGAPALLNTLNELAAAINDDANYTTTITTALGTKANAADVTAALAGKEDALTAAQFTNKAIMGSSGNSYGLVGTSEYLDVKDTNGYNKEIELDIAAVEAKLTTDGYAKQSDIATAQSAAATDATTKANAAQSAAATDATTKVAAEATARNSAISTAISGEVTDRNAAIATAQAAAQADAEATAADALSDAKDGTTPFTKVNVNDVSAIQAATTTVASAGTVNAITWSGSDYRTAKALVKFKNGVNTQVSEVLLTLDTSNNVSITEFGSINTGTDLGTVSAAYASGSVSISVTTTYASTDVMVHATLIK
jgi:hypothetical protein